MIQQTLSLSKTPHPSEYVWKTRVLQLLLKLLLSEGNIMRQNNTEFRCESLDDVFALLTASDYMLFWDKPVINPEGTEAEAAAAAAAAVKTVHFDFQHFLHYRVTSQFKHKSAFVTFHNVCREDKHKAFTCDSSAFFFACKLTDFLNCMLELLPSQTRMTFVTLAFPIHWETKKKKRSTGYVVRERR